MKNKNITKILIPIVLILVALAAAEGLYYFTKHRVPGAISLEGASEKAMNYINGTILEGQTPAVLSGSSEESGVYAIKLEVQGEEYASYVTKDGKFLFLQGVEIPDEVQAQDTGIPKQDKSKAQLFVMSYCPYGNQAEEIMADVTSLLGDKADIEVHYVIYSNYGGGGPNYCLDEEDQYCSMHGIQELNQGIRELCVQKYQKDKLWDFFKEMNTNCSSQNADTCWEGTAKNIGIDVNMVKKCERDEGLALAEEELQLNKKYGISGSPQLIINDTEYSGARTAEAYKTAICSGFNNLPEECSEALSGGGAAAPTGGCE